MTKWIPLVFLGVILGASIVTTRAADSPVTDWPSYNRTLTSERYAPFDQINRTNVSRLKQLCIYDLNVESSFQTGPIVIGRTLYATTDKEILAIDAETCQQKWRVREEGPSLALRVNRGAAYLDRRLFRGTGEGNVLAYDAETGKKLWSTHLADPAKAESIPSAPLAWSGLVFVGTAGSDRYGVTGRVYALEAQTGKVVWETYTVPTDAPQPGNEQMQAQARATWGNANGVPITGGGTWTTFTLDAERGLLYVPVGNPGPDFATNVRPGANLYTNSILDPGCEEWYLSPSLLARAGRFSRLGSGGGAGARDDEEREATWWRAPEGRPAACLRCGDRQEVVCHTGDDTGERRGALVHDADPLLSRSGWRDGMERPRVQSRHEPVLRRDCGLVCHGHARSCRTRQETGPVMDRYRARGAIRHARSQLVGMGHGN